MSLKLEELTRATALTSSDDIILNRDLGGGNFGNRKIASGLVRLASQLVETWSGTSEYSPGHQVIAADGNYYEAKQTTTNNDPTIDAGTYWRLLEARSSLTLNIPSRFSTFALAWDFAKTASIIAPAFITIQFANGTHTMGLNVINHPYGSRIKILGNAGTPASCILDASALDNQVDGSFYENDWGVFSVNNGHAIGYINGFKMTGPGVAQYGVVGLLAFAHASITCGPNMVVEDFYAGIAAVDHSYIFADYITIRRGGDGNMFAYQNSTISAQGCLSEDAATWYGKSGAMIEFGSSLFAPNSTFKNNDGAQITLNHCSSANIDNSLLLVDDASGAAGVTFNGPNSLQDVAATYTGCAPPANRIIPLGTKYIRFGFDSNSDLELFGTFQFILNEAGSLSVTLDNVAGAFLGFTDASNIMNLTTDGPTIRLKIASSPALGGTLVAEWSAKGFQLPMLAADPASPSEGFMWYNTTTHLVKFRNNSTTQTVTSS